MRYIVVPFLLAALCAVGASAAVAAQPQPAAAPAADELVSQPQLGVFYFHPAGNNDEEWWRVAGFVGLGLNALINSTPELKRASLAERARLAPQVDVAAESAALKTSLHRTDGPAAQLSLRYGMSQDLSALIVLAELRPAAAARGTRPLRLAYQSPVHELQAKTAQEIEAEVAEVERRRPELGASQYRKALSEARSPQREWPAIYRAHADYWLADDAAALRAALAQARGRMTQMIGFAREQAPGLAPDGLLAKVGETVSRDGDLRTRVEAADLVVAKRADDSDLYLSWNQFLGGRDQAP